MYKLIEIQIENIDNEKSKDEPVHKIHMGEWENSISYWQGMRMLKGL